MLRKVFVRRPSAGTVLGGLALIVATSGVAVAAIPGGVGTLTVCVPNGGVIKVIDAQQGETCPGKQTMVDLASADAAGKVANANLLDGMDSTQLLKADALPGKVSRHYDTEIIPGGATRGVGVACADRDAVAVGGGAHWGSAPDHHQFGENITGIINASTLVGPVAWTALATNDETEPLHLTIVVVCLNP